MRTTILLFVLFVSLSAFSQNLETKPMITVVGESKIKVIPNFVIISVRVETSGKTASEAKKKHDLSVDAVLKFLKKMKLESKDITTQYLNLNKNYDYNTKVYEFLANQSITITLNDLSKYEFLMQGLLDAGINRIDGIQFSSTELEKLTSDARKLAIQNAKTKALEYVGELGQTIGKAIHISELNAQIVPVYERKSVMADAISVLSGQETVAVGELLITANVNVSFELK